MVEAQKIREKTIKEKELLIFRLSTLQLTHEDWESRANTDCRIDRNGSPDVNADDATDSMCKTKKSILSFAKNSCAAREKIYFAFTNGTEWCVPTSVDCLDGHRRISKSLFSLTSPKTLVLSIY